MNKDTIDSLNKELNDLRHKYKDSRHKQHQESYALRAALIGLMNKVESCKSCSIPFNKNLMNDLDRIKKSWRDNER
jgi:hypothetical protein